MADTQPLLDYIRREFLYDDAVDIREDQNLVPDVVDSLGVMDVVEFVERTYGIEIADDDLTVENFRTLQTIAALIDRRKA